MQGIVSITSALDISLHSIDGGGLPKRWNGCIYSYYISLWLDSPLYSHIAAEMEFL